MRFESPEPESRQGRRNDRTAGVQLLDADGGISLELEACLAHIFAKYCMPRPEKQPGLWVPPEGACLLSEGLDEWARDTNGSAFDDDSKEELLMFMDCNEEGGLTFEGFLQVYQLQTESDEEETWRDLFVHGFDRTLNLVATRREDMDDMETEMEKSPASQQHNNATSD
ncbi:hypothetical protein PHLGIDRAFT_103275 [Phlebiopsis gigantea 11061_1 CR5-6]|uniref:EF-hand domain-containing protein n=1 Tax=Phlebiopsis gigantea (strain 11061_1 CR5-6) TaxID=745531 RepID=A0A0C3NUQ8_PHLG1|nr:hypothetical protein PHLGIDRAFT_103275 [Phlebiopsis gigantea 11061_1 CR5-6]